MAQADVLIGFTRTLDDKAAGRLEHVLGDIPGVSAVRAGSHRDHLLQVFFDPDTIHANGLLNAARNAGFGDGRLIGV